MPVQPTYPGVYIQEEPSGVRTIVGVSTSVALFVGRAKRGPLKKPVRCLNYSDFERTFSSEYADSDLARAVRLFFQNGGTQCYVMRIADDSAVASEVTLKNKAQQPVLRVKARSEGLVGDMIRLSVSYKGSHPESTFNLEVFRWKTNGQGQLEKADIENWSRLSMDPKSPRYVQPFINQNSKLITVEDLLLAAAQPGYSQSGRPVPSRTNAIFRNNWRDLIGTASTDDTNRFRISVDGGPFVDVDLSGIDFSTWANAAAVVANLPTAIADEINNTLPAGSNVAVTMEAGPAGPAGQDHEHTVMLRMASANGDVHIEPATTKDLAQPLMLGSAQGGIEISKYAANRPVPNGIVFDIENLVAFAEQKQSAFRKLHIGSAEVDLAGTLETTASTDLLYQDGYGPSTTGNCEGVKEKWTIIAKAVNDQKAAVPTFKWTAEIWGSRLALISGDNGDNTITKFTSSDGDGVNIGVGAGGLDHFIQNVRYYSLGTSGKGNYQGAGIGGNDGAAPRLEDYRKAFEVIEKEVDLFNLLILPRDSDHTADTTTSLWGPASVFCQQQRAFLLMDPPEAWTDVNETTDAKINVNKLRIGLVKDHSAIFYPRLLIRENGLEEKIGPSGAIAGLMARIDASRGVWKAPAGTEADIRGIAGLEHQFSDLENGVLNQRAINTLRVFPNGIVNWGARTMDGDDDFASEWKYIPIRRTALYIEESLYRGLKWVVFEPNDEPLWAQIRLNVGAFMHTLFRQGAFQGQKRDEAYFVKCDSETTTETDRNLGMVHIWVGFAPLKPAEFVILHLQQKAGKIEV